MPESTHTNFEVLSKCPHIELFYARRTQIQANTVINYIARDGLIVLDVTEPVFSAEKLEDVLRKSHSLLYVSITPSGLDTQQSYNEIQRRYCDVSISTYV